MSECDIFSNYPKNLYKSFLPCFRPFRQRDNLPRTAAKYSTTRHSAIRNPIHNRRRTTNHHYNRTRIQTTRHPGQIPTHQNQRRDLRGSPDKGQHLGGRAGDETVKDNSGIKIRGFSRSYSISTRSNGTVTSFLYRAPRARMSSSMDS